jgi:tetratricopeptide (TPR) repeat protein
MGRKYCRTRQYFFILVAGLILVLSGGCATLTKLWDQIITEPPSPGQVAPWTEETIAAEAKKKDDLAKTYLTQGKRFFNLGDFESSLRQYQKVVDLMGSTSPADTAFFFMGLIQAYGENPKKDYDKSISIMRKVILEFPQSPWVEQAKTWIGVLQERQKEVKDYEILAGEHEKLNKEQEKLIKRNEKLIKENEKLIKMLEEYKQVDIELEEKKREKGR